MTFDGPRVDPELLTLTDGDAVLEPADPDQGDYLTRDQLRELNDNLTMGDVWRARLAAPNDQGEQGMLLFLYAARRTGLVGADAELIDFLDRVRNEDFQDVLAANSPGRLGKSTASTPSEPPSPTPTE